MYTRWFGREYLFINKQIPVKKCAQVFFFFFCMTKTRAIFVITQPNSGQRATDTEALIDYRLQLINPTFAVYTFEGSKSIKDTLSFCINKSV